MIKLVKRSKERAASPRVLANRVRYIENQEHPHHRTKKEVQPAVNFGCRGQSAKDYLNSTHEAHELGKIRIKNQKGGGNPTTDLFFEIIYASPEGSKPTPEERELIEKMILAPFRGCAIRCGWHLADPNRHLAKPKPKKPGKEIHDAHFLISARDRFGKATMNRFGDGKQTFKSWRNNLDQEICAMLNRNREIEYEPVHVLHYRKFGITTNLPQIIALHTKEPVTRDNLVETINQLGHQAQPINEDDKVVTIVFDKREKECKRRIKTLLLEIAEIQLDILLARPDGNEGQGGGAGGEEGGGTGGLAAPNVAQPPADQTQPAQPTKPARNQPRKHRVPPQPKEPEIT